MRSTTVYMYIYTIKLHVIDCRNTLFRRAGTRKTTCCPTRTKYTLKIRQILAQKQFSFKINLRLSRDYVSVSEWNQYDVRDVSYTEEGLLESVINELLTVRTKRLIVYDYAYWIFIQVGVYFDYARVCTQRDESKYTYNKYQLFRHIRCNKVEIF